MELIDAGSTRIPPANRRGRRQPERDHPDVPHDVWSADHGVGLRYPFRFDGLAGRLARVAGCRSTDGVELAHGDLTIRYGPWSMSTPLANMVDAHITGPYQLVKVAGPPHLSLADRGISFATNTELGVCICFRFPVPGALPVGLLRHPAATVTVDDPDGLVRAVHRIVMARAAARAS